MHLQLKSYFNSRNGVLQKPGRGAGGEIGADFRVRLFQISDNFRFQIIVAGSDCRF